MNANNLSSEMKTVISDDAGEGISVKQKPTIVNSKAKDYSPNYSDEVKAKLTTITTVVEEEINRVVANPRYHATPFGNNAVLNLKEAFKDGIALVTPQVNRKHGKDQTKTGESLMAYGSQHITIVITIGIAKAAGLIADRFENDKSQDPVPDDALMMMDGNGRINFLHSIPVENWPDIYAVFPAKDTVGYYNIPKAFEEINTQVAVWKTQDMVQKRVLEEAEATHEGWRMINKLIQNGYLYQAACQLATLGTDRIKKEVVNSGNASDIFKNFKHAKKIFEVLKKKFGEGDDKTIKTKEFTKEISLLWTKLVDKSGCESATESFIKFLNSIPPEKVKEIKEAKSNRNGTSKDSKRKKILDDQFNVFTTENNLL